MSRSEIPAMPDPNSRPKITKPITSDASWNDNPLQPNKEPSKFSKLALPTALALAVCLVGMIIWLLNKDDSDATNASPASAITGTGLPDSGQPKWETATRKVLADYLDAQAQGNLDDRLRLVTPSRETQALLPQYKPRRNSADVVEAAAFVAKPLPKRFTDHGIYLMYYQRPNTLPEDSVFRPIVPIRVRLAIDSPSFLELSARSGYPQTRNRQNICAFFKRGKDDRFTLDWPVFVQTRHRQLEKFTNAPHTESRQVFRLMVYMVQPTLIKNVYNAHLPNHDWYRIHCPGYIQETHVVAVSKESYAGQMMARQFKNSVTQSNGAQALTAEVCWHVSKKDGSPVLGISGIVSWEFYNLNSPELVKPESK